MAPLLFGPGHPPLLIAFSLHPARPLDFAAIIAHDRLLRRALGIRCAIAALVSNRRARSEKLGRSRRAPGEGYDTFVVDTRSRNHPAIVMRSVRKLNAGPYDVGKDEAVVSAH